MKNLYLIYIYLLLCSYIGFSQNENNHWQLGAADVDFTTSPPVVNTNSTASGNYGYSSISDSNGDLLFYTNGNTIWNKNHQIMVNGSNLGDYPESLQRSVIVPHPGDSNKYYVFRHEGTPCLCMSLNYGVYVYSIVDFTNNSLGEVLYINSSPQEGEWNNYTMALKNGGTIINHVMSYSPLTFTKSTAGNYYWLIVQDENMMLSYKIDQNGLNIVPVVSTFATTNQIYNIGVFNENEQALWGVGQSMFRITTGSNRKLYGLESSDINNGSSDMLNYTHRFYRLDFDDYTGQFSNFLSISLYSSNGNIAHNFELSPDYQKAYFVLYRRPGTPSPSPVDGEIIVKDLVNLSTAARTLYETANTTTASNLFYNIQKDKYGNLLVSGYSTTLDRNKYLHIINSPDSYSNSTVTVNYLYLNGASGGSLPQSIPNTEQGCEGNIILTSIETAPIREYKSSGTITTNTNYIINSGSNIVFHAEEAIYLEPNTDIKSGSTFLAEIEACEFAGRFAPQDYKEAVSYELFTTEKRLQLYPNPSSTTTTISLKEGVIKHLTISSLEGAIIFDQKILTASYQLNVERFKKGIYIVTIQTNDGQIFTEKLMKNE